MKREGERGTEGGGLVPPEVAGGGGAAWNEEKGMKREQFLRVGGGEKEREAAQAVC